MPNQFKTPGVYITEIDAFPNSVVAVPTGIPAFVGYTQQATYNGKELWRIPTQVDSMAQFELIFGKAPDYRFTLNENNKQEGVCAGGKFYSVAQSSAFFLYSSVSLFFANGGSICYIVAVGDYSKPVNQADLIGGIDQLKNEPLPDILLVPDAVLLNEQDCSNVQQYMIAHCSYMQNRIALIDVYNGMKARSNDDEDVITRFRNNIGVSNLDYAVSYYPWIHTTVNNDAGLTFKNIQNTDLLKQVLLCDKTQLLPPQATTFQEIVTSLPNPPDAAKAHTALLQLSPSYKGLLNLMLDLINQLPPSGAMAGIYAMVDNQRGVWKTPANITVARAVSPCVGIDNDTQADLNISLSGKSVNAIRYMNGMGVMVWGARTLDGNSLDWRYISVRRTLIMIEQSIKMAAKAYVFEPNDATTWVALKSLLSNFLTNLWKQGGLAGATPTDAFSVDVGLGVTMTGDDIVAGLLRVNVKVAVVRPAEFIAITFQQQMQQS